MAQLKLKMGINVDIGTIISWISDLTPTGIAERMKGRRLELNLTQKASAGCVWGWCNVDAFRTFVLILYHAVMLYREKMLSLEIIIN